MLRLLIGLVACLQLFGCAGEVAAPGCVRFSRHGGYCLQAPPAVPSLELQQEVVWSHDGARQSLLVQIAIAPERMRVVAMTPFGAPLLDTAYADGMLTTARLPDSRLDPAMLLAVVQLATLPEATIRAGLRGALNLVDTPHRRELRDPDGAWLSIERAAADKSYDQLSIPALRLELEVRQLETEVGL